MKFITQLSRILVGGLFIFSGLIKLNDPMGFSFKLNDYFAPDVLNLEFLQPLALSMAIFIVILEVLLGLALLLGLWKKLTNWLLLLMIVFFTFLTFYSAYFNKVTDCGCFGDAIPLTPWESFGKDVILTILILIIFLNQKYIKPIFSGKLNSGIMAVSLLLCSFFGYWVLNHLPAIDFRAYAEGKSIIEGMKSAEELGKEPTKYATIYYLKNKSTGEEKKVDSDAYIAEKWWEKKEWEIQSDKTETEIVSEGYEPPVHDFVITYEDADETQNVLNAPAIFVLIAYNMDKTDTDAYAQINEFAQAADENKTPFIGLSASLPSVVEQMRHDLQTPFPFASMDETTLKTIIRSNPGIVLLKNGVIVKKWHHNDLPDFTTVKEAHL
jgi:uncharacterized membrane protein YphA (DoxX/SURF4 family)